MNIDIKYNEYRAKPSPVRRKLSHAVSVFFICSPNSHFTRAMFTSVESDGFVALSLFGYIAMA
jgi:hypothetical protein